MAISTLRYLAELQVTVPSPCLLYAATFLALGKVLVLLYYVCLGLS